MNTWIRLTLVSLLATACGDDTLASELAQLDAGASAGERPQLASPFGPRHGRGRQVSGQDWSEITSAMPNEIAADDAIEHEVRAHDGGGFGIVLRDGAVPELDGAVRALDGAVPELGDAGVQLDAAVLTDASTSMSDAGDAGDHDAALVDAGMEVKDAGAIDSGTPIDAGDEDAAVVIPDPSQCEPWTSLVTPAGVLRCVQEPPPDPGPFGYRVALTFDDGPNPATTPLVLQTLRAQGVPATFFMVGQRLDNPQAQALAREIHADPLFMIGNHTRTHAHLTMLDAVGVQTEIESTSASIRTALLDPCFFPHYFRFPYSEASCDTVQQVRAHGFAVTGLHIDSSDWCYADGNGYCAPASVPWMNDAFRNNGIVDHVLSQLERYQGGIILMHDIHANTAAMLPNVIAALRDAGVQFVRLDDLATFPALNAEISVPAPPLCCDGHVR